MVENQSYTTEDIAQLLKVSKLTVYDLIKKGDLKAYRVGRQIRVDASELENYKVREQEVQTPAEREVIEEDKNKTTLSPIVISGQDNSLDVLARSLEDGGMFQPLRSYRGSLDSLIAMYQGHADIVSTHMFDGDTGKYNLPYIRKILVSMPFVVFKFIEREAGLYVQKGNPKDIQTWEDLSRQDVTIVNRERGAGARILLDEQLRLHKIKRDDVKGYTTEQTSHLAVASTISNGQADVGVGIKNAANMAAIDFVSKINESYDLVVLNTHENKALIEQITNILKDKSFRDKLQSLGYNIDNMGAVVWKQ